MKLKTGAFIKQDGECEFTVWAPFLNSLELKVLSLEKLFPLERKSDEYFSLILGGIKPDSQYVYVLEKERERPDPVSNYQPLGVHGPSQIIDHSSFNWDDKTWRGISLEEMIIYELHVGTFTNEGSFNAIIPRLDELGHFGINSIEIMPVSQFPGERNWGYDGTYPFAVQNSYGGPSGLKNLINECHKRDMAVILDVVYNHLGPEGNYLGEFGPYFTDKYKTPWGNAINFDDAFSEGVRNYFIQNALFWFENYHIDALRLDAIHGIFDFGARHILEELSDNVSELSRELKRNCHLIAESDLNDSRIVKPKELGGYSIKAQWSDDFHHCVHTLLTGEKSGYYDDFGGIKHLEKAYREGFVYSWDYSKYRKRRHGNSSSDVAPNKFVVFSQNHDQIGNRAFSERLTRLTDFEGIKLSAACVLLSPYIPLIFMGEEYGEDNPFYYFISHGDKDLIEAVRKGRQDEFKAFKWEVEPPDPYSMDTFVGSKIDWEKRGQHNYKTLLEFYGVLIKLRKEIASLNASDKRNLETRSYEGKNILLIKRSIDSFHTISVMNFSKNDSEINIDCSDSKWTKILDSSDIHWSGPGAIAPKRLDAPGQITLKKHSFVLYLKEK